jgi:S1-C subfamily serine protease
MAQPAIDPFHALDHGLAAAVATAAPAVLHVVRARGGGSAIAWAPDLAITSSFHVPDHTSIGVPLADGELERRDAEVIGRDPGTDVALLRIAGGGLTAAPLRDDAVPLAVGNLALAIGRPGRSVRASLRAIGVIGHDIRTPAGGKLDRYIESDRQIPRGFAGGALADADGAVIGMNTRTLIRGCDLAIAVPTLRRVIDELLVHGAVRRGYLGVGAYPATLPASLAQLAGLGAPARAALIAAVDDGSPAAQAGLIVGDLLVALDAVAITGPESLRQALAERADQRVTAVVVRGGARVELPITIGTKS